MANAESCKKFVGFLGVFEDKKSRLFFIYIINLFKFIVYAFIYKEYEKSSEISWPLGILPFPVKFVMDFVEIFGGFIQPQPRPHPFLFRQIWPN